MAELNRNRLINAVVFFARNTRYCGKIKLFKLLYLMDFEHFRKTGKSVTGSEYSAWKFGPVPDALYEEWERPEEDFAEAVDIVAEPVIDYVRQTVVPKVAFSDAEFTPRQLRIMGDLAQQYRDTRAPDMIDVVHAENGAWARVWADGQGRNQRIAYELALAANEPHREAILERHAADLQREAARAHFAGR